MYHYKFKDGKLDHTAITDNKPDGYTCFAGDPLAGDDGLVDWTRIDSDGLTLTAKPVAPVPEPYVPTLTEAQASAWESIKRQRTARDKQPLSYLGGQFDFADAEDREKIDWMVAAAKRASERNIPFAVDWTMADNSVLTLTAEQVLDIPLVVAARSDANHQKARAIKARIDAAGTAGAVQVILAEPDLWEGE